MLDTVNAMDKANVLAMRNNTAELPEILFDKAIEIRYIRGLIACAYMQGFRDGKNNPEFLDAFLLKDDPASADPSVNT